jgi:hypothetical protein
MGSEKCVVHLFLTPSFRPSFPHSHDKYSPDESAGRPGQQKQEKIEFATFYVTLQ